MYNAPRGPAAGNLLQEQNARRVFKGPDESPREGTGHGLRVSVRPFVIRLYLAQGFSTNTNQQVAVMIQAGQYSADTGKEVEMNAGCCCSV